MRNRPLEEGTNGSLSIRNSSDRISGSMRARGDGKQHSALKTQVYAQPHTEPRRTLHSRVAYRVRTKNGTLVLCEKHLDQLRAHEGGVRYTGDTFAVSLCDHCIAAR